MDWLDQLLGSTDFIPHGHCYLWSPSLVWTEVGSNLLIGLAYLAIAATLIVLMRRLREVPFRWMYYAFAVFIFACGITHFSDILVIWKPYYWADASIRVVTAVASVATALLLPPPNRDSEPSADGNGSRNTPSDALIESARELSEQRRSPDEVDPSAALKRHPHVLVVEDNVHMNDYICETLGDEFATLSVYDGKQGLEKLEHHHIDVIVTDLMMPKMSGTEFIDRVTESGDVPILIVTARVEEKLRTQLLRKGANDFLPKPFSAEELRSRVSNLASIRRTRKVLQHELTTRRESIEILAQRLATRNTELERALDSARLAREHAERASEMKTDFLGLVSHELRTPLTALQMQFHLLKERIDAPVAQRRPLIDRISTVLDRLLDVIEGLLNQAALESGQLEATREEFDLVDLVEETLEANRPLATANDLELEFDAASDSIEVETDARMVRLIVTNLVRNAVKFTEQGGVYVSASRTDGDCTVDVRDTGPGIDKDEQSDIFDAFRRTEQPDQSQTPGVGVGLSIVRDLVQTLGGSVRVDSEPDRGSTFSVTFPTTLPTRSNPIEPEDDS